MKIKNLLLLAFVSVFAGMATAGTLTIKAPPKGLLLHTSAGKLEYGDKDLILTGVSVTNGYISPDLEGDIIGFVDLFHSEGAEWLYGNHIACTMDGKYSVKMKIVGFKEETCNGDSKKLTQLRTEGANDVVITFTKNP